MIGFWMSGGLLVFAFLLKYEPEAIKVLREEYKAGQYMSVYDCEGLLIGQCGYMHNYVPLDEIPAQVIQALLATEDKYFWRHFGFNPIRMARAVAANIKQGKITRGGSTVSQQLAKNILLTNHPELIKNKTKRKIKESILTLQLELSLTKRAILEHYLNRVYFGRGAYGICAAAKMHFGKKLDELTVGETAFLIGLIQAPSTYSRSKELGINRMRHVLKRMYSCGYISADTFMSELEGVEQVRYQGSVDSGYNLAWLSKQIPDWLKSSGRHLKIVTTLSTRMQNQLFQKIPAIKEKSRFNFNETAFMLADMDGAVRIMIGGMSSGLHVFNRAAQSNRPAGSIFKIYVFLAALLSKLKNGKTLVEDTPVKVGKWRPGNYYHNEVGMITAERAFSESVNSATIRIAMEYTNLHEIINTARLLGIVSPIPHDCSLILGSASLSPYEVLQSILTIANDGFSLAPYCISEIYDQDTDELLWTYNEKKVRVINNESALDELRYLMGLVVKSPRGTGRAIKNDNYEIYAKTGTSQDYRDVWFAGMTEDGRCFVCWCGKDDYSPMTRKPTMDVVHPAIGITKAALQISDSTSLAQNAGPKPNAAVQVSDTASIAQQAGSQPNTPPSETDSLPEEAPAAEEIPRKIEN